MEFYTVDEELNPIARFLAYAAITLVFSAALVIASGIFA